MIHKSKRLTEWLQPVPEEEYLRIVYVGKLQICSKSNNNNITQLENMINDIWNVSKAWNSTHGISGHLAYTQEHHISQLIEGKAVFVKNLMARIRNDPRVVIHKEFKRTLLTMNLGWNISMCYSFQITADQYRLIADDDITAEQMFDSMKNTYEIRREGWKLSDFYKTIVDTFLLKYISVQEKVQFKEY